MLLDKIALEQHLHQHIPISKAMGVDVEKASQETLTIQVPIKPNINHKQTVFGGSIHSSATIACWSLLLLNLQTLDEYYHIVIAKSEIDYVLPIDDDFKVTSNMNLEAFHSFRERLLAKGKARSN